MLLTWIALLSAASAVGISIGCASGLNWLWVFPLSFVGVFLLLGLVAFLFLLLVCAAVDVSRPRSQDSPFYRTVTYRYEEAVITLLGIRLRTTGLEQLPRDGRFLLVCNHISDLDPLMLHTAFQSSQLAFISKRENSGMFVVGKLMHMTLCQLINRENDREALKTILACVDILRQDKASIAVFPEGYTSLDRLLHPFRSGVFKIAQKAHVPIVVCTVQNTHKVFHRILRLKPTEVQLHLVGVIPADELKGQTAVSIGARVHDMMAADLGPELVWQDSAEL